MKETAAAAAAAQEKKSKLNCLLFDSRIFKTQSSPSRQRERESNDCFSLYHFIVVGFSYFFFCAHVVRTLNSFLFKTRHERAFDKKWHVQERSNFLPIYRKYFQSILIRFLRYMIRIQ